MKKLLSLALFLALTALTSQAAFTVQFTDDGSNAGVKYFYSALTVEDKEFTEEYHRQGALDVFNAFCLDEETRNGFGYDTWAEYYPGIYGDMTGFYMGAIPETTPFAITTRNDGTTGTYGCFTYVFFPNGFVAGAPYVAYDTPVMTNTGIEGQEFQVAFSELIEIGRGNLKVDAPEPVCGLLIFGLAALALCRK